MSRYHVRLRKIAIALLLLIAHIVPIPGQVNTATLVGTVKDATGAAVPNAPVTVKSIETSQERTVPTDASGNYTITNLQVGHYTVAVSVSGFKTTTISDVELQGAERAPANL